MRSAAVNRDAETFCSYIDFPVLRENLKAELNAKMLFDMNNDRSMKDNPFSGLALAAGPALINNMVDGYVSPASIERMFKGNEAKNIQSPNLATQTFNQDFMSEKNGDTSIGYDSFNQFWVIFRPKTGSGNTTFIFERRNLFRWELINMKVE